MNISIETIRVGASKIGNYVKTGAKRASKSIKEINDDTKANIQHIREAIQENREVGAVHKAGVTDNNVLEQLGPAEKGLQDYAKANNINIILHTPQKPAEVGSNDFEKPLTITAYKKGFINSYMTTRTIDGDVNKISKAQVKLPSNGKKAVADVEDTFLRRVYRNISEMAEEINTQREENQTGRLSGLVDEELKEEIKASNQQIRGGVKDFFGMLNPFKK